MTSHEEYHHASADEIAAHVLAFALKSRASEFQELLLGIYDRKDYLAIEMVVTDTLLKNDFVAMYRNSFEDGYLSNWCKDNVGYVVRNCHDTLMVWMEQVTSERPGKVVGIVARELSAMPESERLRLLRGEFNEPFVGYREMNSPNGLVMGPQKRLHQHLLTGRRHWRELSPSWVSTPELRQAASALGWKPDYLPAMVYRNIWEAGSEGWIGQTSYPYTLMACEMFRQAQNFGQHAPKHLEIITCSPTTTAVDIALAKKIIALAPHTDNMALRRPQSIKALDVGTEQRIDGFVRAHVAMDTLGDLSLALAHGMAPRLEAEEAVALPDLTETLASAGQFS